MGAPIASLTIITPSCLSVERAIIFFMSHSVIALIPAINVVRTARIKRILWKQTDEDKKGQKRNNRKIPAVTSVEEWTRADTGVGAAIAAGSHLENGI